MSTCLTNKIKQKALELGTDLVGVGNIERWDNCLLLMSPQGILPTAKSVVVCALHHTDAMVECSCEDNPHDHQSYASQCIMNFYLDRISYDMARDLEDNGFSAVPISASNIWRYKPYKSLNRNFCPDMSNIYSPVAAGLAEMGYHGMAMNPKYGPRCRYVSIVTDAPLEPDPLLPGNTLCDNCGLCKKHCPTAALRTEISGMTSLQIEGNEYPFADKNLWRCAWGEHFGLDVSIELPEKVDEQFILESVEKHGQRGNTMGQCLKYCLPKHLRTFDKKYSSSPRRKKISSVDDSVSTTVQDKMFAELIEQGCDLVKILDKNSAKANGIDIEKYLPNAKSIAIISLQSWSQKPSNNDCKVLGDNWWPNFYIVHKANYNMARQLEGLGFEAAPYTFWTKDEKITNIARESLNKEPVMTAFCVTDANLNQTEITAYGDENALGVSIKDEVKEFAISAGVDVVGISSPKRISDVAQQLQDAFKGELILNATDVNPLFTPYKAQIEEIKRVVYDANDYMANAGSVIVLGVRVPQASVTRATEPPSESIGPYVFAQFESHRILQVAALKLIRHLAFEGHKSLACYDLCGTASVVGTPREDEYPDVFANRFAAVCAGLGTIGKGGFVINEKFGANIRFIAIVTDKRLQPDEVVGGENIQQICRDCDKCIKSCTVSAHNKEVAIEIEKQKMVFQKVEQNRCDWAKRYALVGAEGFENMGSETNVLPPDVITEENLTEALSKHSSTIKFRFCSVEMCAKNCPITGTLPALDVES